MVMKMLFGRKKIKELKEKITILTCENARLKKANISLAKENTELLIELGKLNKKLHFEMEEENAIQ